MEKSRYEELQTQIFSEFEKGGLKTALRYIDDCIKKTPDSIEAYLVRSELYIENGDFKKALNDIEKSIMINSNVAESYFNRGFLFAKSGSDVKKALADFTKAIELDPDYAEAYTNRANMYLKLRETQRAIDDCNKAIELSPDDMESYYNRGLAYYKIGELEKALEDYDKVIELAPENVEAYGKRGLLNAQSGNISEAIRDYEKFLELDPNNLNAKLIQRSLLDLKSGKTPREIERNKSLTTMIIGCVMGAVIIGLLSGFRWLGFVIGAYLGLGIGPFWEDLKEELVSRFSVYFAAIRQLLNDDVAEKGLIKGHLLGIFILTPFRFLIYIVMFLVWPGLKLYFKLLISPFIAISEFVQLNSNIKK